MSRRETRAILKRLDAAREGLFPHRTCPASRHVHLIVEGLLDTKCPLHRDLLGYEPEHMAGSIASVLEDLWKARRWMRWQPNIEGDYTAGGEWVPDLEALTASGIVTAQADETRSGSVERSEIEPGGEAETPTPSPSFQNPKRSHD